MSAQECIRRAWGRVCDYTTEAQFDLPCAAPLRWTLDTDRRAKGSSSTWASRPETSGWPGGNELSRGSAGDAAAALRSPRRLRAGIRAAQQRLYRRETY